MTRWHPFARITEDEGALLVRVDLGDVRPENVKIDAKERLLTIHGERAWPYGAFCRSFPLPETVDGAAAVAIMSDGVLTIRIPPRSDTFAA
jgi:HSP20 family protein